MRPIIYQVLVRLFGNQKRSKTLWGSVKENGIGKMNSFSDKALSEIKKMGFSHIWYTGLIEHASCTDHSEFGIPNDHPSVVKGVAGSPYAIKDYYDIAPDLASDIPNRMKEFDSLVKRTHKQGLKLIIDFVPNHLARQYHSDAHPENVADFGIKDDTSKPFSPSNNFYYIPDENLEVPPGENNHRQVTEPYNEFPAKATGNDVFSSRPSINDWYETIKLNYGVDYQNNRATHFDPIPDTWIKMKDILLYWAGKGVDGFRCDMAELVPVEFWQWVTSKIKETKPEIIFIAEVYQPDLYRRYIYEGGFDFLYDKVELYDTLKSIIQGHGSSDQIPQVWQTQEGIGDHMLRFLENHDEQRIASPFFANDPRPGIPMMTATAFMHKGPVMIYFGQEVGEPANGTSGFSGDDGRTTIFDYWSVPEHQKWMNEGAFDGKKLSEEQKSLREAYINILKACNENTLFQSGDFYDLQYFSRSDDFIGYSDKVYSFIRHNNQEGILVVINFASEISDISIKLPYHFCQLLQLNSDSKIKIDGRSYSVKALTNPGSSTSFSISSPPYSYKLYTVKASK
ncbi:MAG: alpha-amylase family glycosyl hydrolase [Bacteroidota bacterium]